MPVHAHVFVWIFYSVIVPLALKEQVRGDYWYLNIVYGDQPVEILEILLGCIVLTVFLFIIALISHCLLVSKWTVNNTCTCLFV